MIRKQTLNKIKKYLKDNNWGTTNEDIIELITESDPVWMNPELDSHRHFNLQEVVVMPIDNVYIKYNRYIITGDYGMIDLDLEYFLDDFIEVLPKEKIVTVTIYEPIQQND